MCLWQEEKSLLELESEQIFVCKSASENKYKPHSVTFPLSHFPN